MPFSRSRSIESITRSLTSWFSRKAPDCQSMASTSVVLPWSTWATMAMLRRSSRVAVGEAMAGELLGHRSRLSLRWRYRRGVAGVDIRVRVVPRAKRDELAGERAGALLVRVTAPPVDGKANDAVCRLIAKAAGVPPSRVSVVRGAVGARQGGAGGGRRGRRRCGRPLGWLPAP